MSASSSAGLASHHSLVRAPSRLTSTVSGSHALAPYARVTAPWELLLPPWGFVLYGVSLFHLTGGQRLSLPLTPPTLSPTSLCTHRAPRHRCGARPAFTLCPGRACRFPYTRVRRSPLLSAPAFAGIELLPYAISTPTVAPPCLDRHPEVCLSRHLTRPRPCSASLAHRRHARDAISPRSAIT